MSYFREAANAIFNEAKQVGRLYHASPLKGIKAILDSNELVSFGPYGTGYSDGISLTRDKSLFYNGGTSLILDGDKLSENYRLNPYSIFSMWPETKTETEVVLVNKRFKPINDEDPREDAVPNIKKYIIGIRVLDSFFNKEELIKLYNILKQHNISHVELGNKTISPEELLSNYHYTKEKEKEKEKVMA